MEIVPYSEPIHGVALRRLYLDARTVAFSWLDTSTFGYDDFDKDTEGESILVLRDHQQVLGFSSVWQPEGFLHHLYLAPHVVRKGHGTELLKQTVASVSGVVRLKCLSLNTTALKFYKANHWQVIGEGHGDDGHYYEMEHRKAGR